MLVPDDETLVRDAAPNSEMAAIMARLAEEDGGLPDQTTLPLDQGRSQNEAVNRRWNRDLPALETVEDLVLGGRPARRFRPAVARGTVLYIHGGGWAFCSLATHDRAMRCLALATGMEVLGLDYRLAPEHPFPLPVDDSVAAWRDLAARGGAAGGPIAISGDSAGANLAVAAMLHEAREGRALPDFALLFYGVYDDDHGTPSHRSLGVGYGLTTARMQCYWDWYAPSEHRRNTLATPLRAPDADLAALPPLYLNAAGLDPLLSDTLRLARRLDRLGRRRDALTIHPGVVHGFMQMTLALAEARAAFEAAGAFCRAFGGPERG